MPTEILLDALRITNRYLTQNYTSSQRQMLYSELRILTASTEMPYDAGDHHFINSSYDEIQLALACLNEKESIRKNKGVYYTPSDIVQFILANSVKMACIKRRPDSLSDMDLGGVPYGAFCYRKTVYDPTCGTGVFLVAALEMKLDMLARHQVSATRGRIRQIVATIRGNDLNSDSVAITKLRLFLCVLHRYGVAKARGLAQLLNTCFTVCDFVTHAPDAGVRYDVIIGNPPYVEDTKSESIPKEKYGNIYANVLENAALRLQPGGVMGFIIPLSYISTPRMEKIRNVLYRHLPEQYILSFSDRPDCLFSSVHQKLCVLFGRNTGDQKKGGRARAVYTGNYRYWYREERRELFRTIEVVKNALGTQTHIPKLGNMRDISIYKKIMSKRTPLLELLQGGESRVYLNMRAAFWIKAFLDEHSGAEYKAFGCADESQANFALCLLNSSLFWWYWICASDCWHITRKELEGFKVPRIQDYRATKELAAALERRLEETKVYVGTKQTEYEYKHRDCVAEIHRIDDYINALYGLTAEESLYIKKFAYRYRISGGVEDECD